MKSLEEIYGVSTGTPTQPTSVSPSSPKKKSLEEIYGVKQPASPIDYGEMPLANTEPVDKMGRLADLGKGVADFVVDPFRQIGQAGNNMFKSQENDTKSYENFSGETVDVPGYKDGQELGGFDTAKQVGGAGLGIASTVVPFLKGAKALELMKAGPILSGLGIGYAQDVSQNVKEGDLGLGALVPGMNTAVGGGLGIFGTTVRTLSKPVSEGRAEAFTSGIEGLRNRTQATENAFQKSTIVRKGADGVETKITPVDTWFKNDAPIPTVNTEGGTAAVDASQAVKHFNDLIDTTDNQLIDSLNTQGVKFASQDVKNIAEHIVNTTENVAGIANGKTTRKEILDALTKRIDNLSEEHGDLWTGEAVRKVLKGANADFKDEATKDVSRLLGDSMRELMYNYTDAGRPGLAKLQELINARNFADTINGKKVAGGGLGRYFARAFGTAVGGSLKLPFGIGEIVGAVGGDSIAKAFQKASFISVTAEAKAKLLKLLRFSGATADEVKAAEKVIKVKSESTPNKIKIDSSDYIPSDENLPVIDMGPKAQSKFNKVDPNLPVAEGAPNVYGKMAPDSYRQEAYIPDNELPTIPGFAQTDVLAKLGLGSAGAIGAKAGYDKLADKYGTETYTREPEATQVDVGPAVVNTYKDKHGEVLKLDSGVEVRPAGPYADAIKQAYKAFPTLPKGFLEAMLMKESSMGTQGQDHKNPGEYGWLVALTKNTVKDIKAKSIFDPRYRELASKLNFDTPQDAIMSAAAYAAFRQRNYSDSKNYTLEQDPVKLYIDRYHAAPSTGRMAEKTDQFKKFVEFYSKS